jgi:hypothetical protein
MKHWAKGFHAANPRCDILEQLQWHSRFELSKDDDPTLPGLEFELDIEGVFRLNFDRADAHSGQVPNRDLSPEGLKSLTLESRLALHERYFPIKENFPI